MTAANDNDVMALVSASGALDDVLALGAILGRGWAAAALGAHGAAMDAGEDVGDLIRAIDTRCGAGVGNDVAYELRAAIGVQIAKGLVFSAGEDALERQLEAAD